MESSRRMQKAGWTNHRNSLEIHLGFTGRSPPTTHTHTVHHRLEAFCSVSRAGTSLAGRTCGKCRPTLNHHHRELYSTLTKHHAVQKLLFSWIFCFAPFPKASSQFCLTSLHSGRCTICKRRFVKITNTKAVN